MITHAEGIARLADAILRERPRPASPDWLVKECEGIAIAWLAAGWTVGEVQRGLANLAAAIEKRLDEMERSPRPAITGPLDALRAMPIRGTA